MLYNHFTEELLGLQGVKITNVEQEENLINVYYYNMFGCGSRATSPASFHLVPKL